MNQKNFQSSKSSTHVTNQSMFKYNHKYRCDGSNVKCQSLSIEIKYKCDDLDHQVSITNSDHYLLLVELFSIKAQSTLK